MTGIWQVYVARIVGDRTQQEVAEMTGLSQTTIGRWLAGVKAPTETAKVAAFAQGMNRHVLEAFVAAAMIHMDEVKDSLTEDSHDFLSATFRSGGHHSPS